MSNYHVQTLANSIIGTSILAMPYCFSKCGVILSIILLVISTFLTRSCCHYLIKASIVTRRRNMALLGFHILGTPGKTLVELSVIGFLMGTCIAFFVVIGDLSPLIVSKIFNTHSISHDNLRKLLIILLTVTTVIPLSFQKNLESLAFVSQASIGFYVCLTLKTVAESFEIFENDPNWSSNIKLWDSSGVLQCIPIFSMATSCQMQLFEVYETMSGSFDHIKRTVNRATLICMLVYCIVGFFGYVAFYNQTLSGNVLMNFTSSLANDAITIGFILSIACSFPLVIFPCRTCLASFLHRKNLHPEMASYVPESRYQPLTLFIIFSTMVLGILIPSVEVIISLVGSTIGTLVCLIFPALCFVKIMTRNSAEKTVAQVMIAFGIVVMVLGTYANLMTLDKSGSENLIHVKMEPVVEHPRDIRIVPPEIVEHQHVEKKLVEHKISDDGIKKEEQEIAADKASEHVLSSKDPKIEIQEKNEEIQELKDTNDKLEKEVQQMKEVLVKQNKETQELVLQKFEEIADKVDKIEKQSLQEGSSGKEAQAQPEVKEVKLTVAEEIKVPDLVKSVASEVKLQEKPLENLQPLPKSSNEKPKILEVPEKLKISDTAAKSEDQKLVQAPAVESKDTNVNIIPELIKNPSESKLPDSIKPETQNADKPKDPRIDPIVKLIKSQEPLSYQVGEKIAESKKSNATLPDPVKIAESLDSAELKNEMRKKRELTEELFVKGLEDMRAQAMVSRDLKQIDDET